MITFIIGALVGGGCYLFGFFTAALMASTKEREEKHNNETD